MKEANVSEQKVRVLGFALAQELSTEEVAEVSGAYNWSVCGGGPGNMDDGPVFEK